MVTSKKGKNRKLWILLAAGFSFGFASAALALIFTLNLTVTKIDLAAPLMVQLDSFLVGGWVVGFFYYWRDLERAWRRSKRVRSRLKLPNDPAGQFTNATNVTLYAHMQAMEKQLGPSSRTFATVVTAVISLVLSGFTVVVAVLTDSWVVFYFSWLALIFGVITMVLSWYGLWRDTSVLRNLADFAEARANS